MADARALLKAKRQEARISHPYASYNASGQLKCSVCGVVVKHASAWEGHLGSKQHRTNLLRLREEEKRHQQQNAPELELPERNESAEKRKAPDESDELQPDKRRRVEVAQGKQSLPQDFFSDPSHAPVLSHDSDEDSGDDEEGITPAQKPATAPAAPSLVDEEYERFQRELLSADVDTAETYNRATVAAEPVMASAEISGFPSTAPEVVLQEPPQLSEAEARLKREQEERELIMDRLLAEERAQEDADTRVQLLKAKLETLRMKRQVAKAHKKHSS
ncbi:hypothetical protein CVT26_014769 [Gymnopilus dilepis]|uniref:Uncharacterized protein n=1 Tax=Gymnopilus dilepis TaxID=231916 RepID=A0A409W3T3_9AGAR|nr:hypothetical protein CVT26_014769 [Gymnopilus dilepis]